MTDFRDRLRQELILDEGYKKKPYRDTEGILSIGVGRNLEAVGLRDDEILLLFNNDMDEATELARDLIPAFDDLSDNRKWVVCDMAFQLGERLADFVNTIAAINDGRFFDAAAHMLDSKVAREQAPNRWMKLAANMRDG